ncbi:MAG TPA: adenylate/guanylate cyclase domain-containing protein [Pirellulaceae bacterium]|nr:adenylate/guanylate cyclase domain-containing protein [Pirellulaceae bacterium]
MLYFTLANGRQRRTIQHERGPIEFGRGPQHEVTRVVVEDRCASRDQLRIEELPSGDVRLENLGSVIRLGDGAELATGEVVSLRAPLRLSFGYTTLEIGAVPQDAGSERALQALERAPPTLATPTIQAQLSATQSPPSTETLGQWFETLLGVQRAAAGSGEFYGETARAVVNLVGLDRGLVLLKQGEQWEIVAIHSTRDRPSQQFSRSVLNQVVAERRTHYENFQGQSVVQSLYGIEAVVASPIFDEQDSVVGVVYGSRDLSSAGGQRGVQPLEAQFVQLLAGAVSAGLARLDSEAEAARARVQFEQFFSPELARALERDPQVLAAQDRELTLLFADLRGFSRISERVGAKATYDLLADILDRLTNQVMDHGGVVIDYYGDGLAAMWNAPAEQTNHAELAAQAALAMQGELPAINSVWAERLNGLIRLGIGINTGLSQVGNAGSRRRLKYGPRGHAVNLTSRIESATKLLGVGCLITEATQRQLPATILTRRLCRGRLSGLTEPVALFELAPANVTAAWRPFRESYEQALRHYEQDEAERCLAICRVWQQTEFALDPPLMLLMHKAEARLTTANEAFEPVYALETK